jgi:hypothetical protein
MGHIDCIPCFWLCHWLANGFLFCYTVNDAIGHAIRYIIDYANDKAIAIQLSMKFAKPGID